MLPEIYDSLRAPNRIVICTNMVTTKEIESYFPGWVVEPLSQFCNHHKHGTIRVLKPKKEK